MHHKAHDGKAHDGPRPALDSGAIPALGLAALTALPPILLAASALTAVPAAHAQGITLTVGQAAVNFSGGVVENAVEDGGTSFCLGYSFTVDSPVAVTALGFYDGNNTADADTAMMQSHAVGIFDASGNLLVQSNVTNADAPYDAYNDAPGSTGDGYQLVRYDTDLLDGATGLISLPAFVLTPGQTYRIAGVTGSDNYSYLSDTFTAAPGIHYIQDQYYAVGGDGNTTMLRAPTQSYGDNYGGLVGPGFFGPDFRFTSASVAGAPEPSEWAALGFTGLAVGGLLLRARKRLRM